MKFKIKTRHIASILIGIVAIILAIVFLQDTRWLRPLVAIGLFFMVSQFLLDFTLENKKQQEIESKFLEFVRSISNSVKSGIPVPKAIMMVADADYGSLSPYVKKLAKQLEWGFPLRQAFMTFARDTENKLIKKSITIVIEAEKSGGNIQEVLSAVTASVLQIKKIKEERKSMIFSQTLQGYIVFFIFIGIMIVLVTYLLPQLEGMGGMMIGDMVSGGSVFEGGELTEVPSQLNYDLIFTGLILIQGFFAGLLVGKFSEGELKYGIKHSLIMMMGGYLLFATAVGI
jgi:flagellar protein FlaJ